MKKCPVCEKTFDDSMKFCQIDGTPLVEDAPFDPFATIVGVAPPVTSPETEAAGSQTDDIPAISEPDDVLDLPDADPLRTMYVSEDEMKAALSSDADAPTPGIVDLPPIEDPSTAETIVTGTDTQKEEYLDVPPANPEPEPPNFSVPDVPSPSFGDMAPPPSPFSTGSSGDIPVSAPSFEEPAIKKKTFNEAETIIQGDYTNPFESQATAPMAEWTPPPAPEPSWQSQQAESNMPFQPSAAVAAGQNKTLAIISLVAGILGVTICCGGLLPSIAAIITGVMARSKANQNPTEYGGSGMAMAGIITGVVGLLGGIVVMVFWLLGTFANLATGNF